MLVLIVLKLACPLVILCNKAAVEAHQDRTTPRQSPFYFFLPGARTRIETLVALGQKPELVPNEDLMEGVNAARKTVPFARFDAKRCARGLEALRSYRTEGDEKARAFKKTPDHKWASHGADAWSRSLTASAVSEQILGPSRLC
jgi:hypothetical protein